MKLIDEVTFDSLGAVHRELNEWLGTHAGRNPSKQNDHTRDLLIAVLIHNLADEISNHRVRSMLRAALAELNHAPPKRTERSDADGKAP